MSELPYQAFDADNHYYEALDAFTRHLDPKLGPRCVQWAEINGRKLPRRRRQGEPRGRESDVRPDRQGRRDARLLPRQPGRASSRGSSSSTASRSRPSTATATPASPSSTSSASRRCGCSRRSASSTRSCSKHDIGAVTQTFTAFNRWLDEDWGFAYRTASSRRRTSRSADLDWAIRSSSGRSTAARACIVMRPAAPHTRRRADARERSASSIRSGRACRRPASPSSCTRATAATRATATPATVSRPRSRRRPLRAEHQVVRNRARRVRLPHHARVRQALRPLPQRADRVGRERLRLPRATCSRSCARPTARCPATSPRTRSSRSGATSG